MIKADSKLIWNGKAVIGDFDGAQFKSLFKSANLVLNDAVTNVAVDKGQLKQSLEKVVTKDNAFVGTNVEHAPHVEFGTRPHTISIKDKKVLSDGKSFFGKSVNHPGTKAQPFLLPALTKNIRKIIAIFKDEGIKLKWVSKKKGFK